MSRLYYRWIRIWVISPNPYYFSLVRTHIRKSLIGTELIQKLKICNPAFDSHTSCHSEKYIFSFKANKYINCIWSALTIQLLTEYV